MDGRCFTVGDLLARAEANAYNIGKYKMKCEVRDHHKYINTIIED
jgi:hypothetical protein